MRALATVLERLYLVPPPDIETRDPRELARIAGLGFYVRRLGRQTVIDLARILPMSIAELLDDWFESDALKGALGALGMCLYIPTLMAPVYTMAKRSACTLRFHVATEGGWDAGNVAACFLSAGLIAAGLPLSYAMLLSLLGSAVTFIMLRRYYRDNPNVPIEAIEESAAHP